VIQHQQQLKQSKVLPLSLTVSHQAVAELANYSEILNK